MKIYNKIVLWINQNLFEIRVKSHDGIQRMFYFRIVNSKYAIISGFTKKTQKTPVRELNHARKLRDEYLREEDSKNGNY